MVRKTVFLILPLILFAFLFSGVFAQENSQGSLEEETLEGKVIKILKEEVISQADGGSLYQKLEVLITKGSLKDKRVTIEVGDIPIIGQPKYKKGDEVLISYGRDFEGNEVFYITDFIRRKPLAGLFLLFVVVSIIVARGRGLSSLLGMGFSFLVIFEFILPKILAGADPILIAIIGSLFIIPSTFYLSHGWNKKTTAAIIGTLAALIITGLLAGIWVEATGLTGFASEEAGFLRAAQQGTVNIRGLLLAGIIIGVLGVLDDVTISQSAIVFQLKRTNARMKRNELYQRAMDVGRDHIASMVNTLILVYTGAALPLLLLFINNPHPFSEVINYEIVANEVVRTLVGSVGLVLAVPITTFIAALITELK